MTRARKNASPEFKGLLCVLLLMHLEAFRSECGQNKERLEAFSNRLHKLRIAAALYDPYSDIIGPVVLLQE